MSVEALTRGAAILGFVMPLFAMLSALVLAAAPLPADVGLGVPGSDPQPIIGGDPVALSEWPSVVAIVGIQGGFTSNTANLCTAVLLDPQTALTAAHCLEEAEDFEQILVIFGDTIYTVDDNRRTTGVDYGVHPSYCLGECEEDVYDFGYVVLAEPVQGVPTIPPLVDQAEWDELMVPDHEVLLVGFGAVRDAQAEDSSPPLRMDEVGSKRSVTTVLSSLSSTGLEFFAGQEGRDTCNGDSGGPVFAQLANGEWRLVGITSRGVTPCGSGRGIYGVPYAALPWIAEETGVDLLPASCAEADCLDIAPPEEKGRCSVVSAEESRAPSLFGLSLLALVVVGRRRR